MKKQIPPMNSFTYHTHIIYFTLLLFSTCSLAYQLVAPETGSAGSLADQTSTTTTSPTSTPNALVTITPPVSLETSPDSGSNLPYNCSESELFKGSDGLLYCPITENYSIVKFTVTPINGTFADIIFELPSFALGRKGKATLFYTGLPLSHPDSNEDLPSENATWYKRNNIKTPNSLFVRSLIKYSINTLQPDYRYWFRLEVYFDEKDKPFDEPLQSELVRIATPSLNKNLLLNLLSSPTLTKINNTTKIISSTTNQILSTSTTSTPTLFTTTPVPTSTTGASTTTTGTLATIYRLSPNHKAPSISQFQTTTTDSPPITSTTSIPITSSTSTTPPTTILSTTITSTTPTTSTTTTVTPLPASTSTSSTARPINYSPNQTGETNNNFQITSSTEQSPHVSNDSQLDIIKPPVSDITNSNTTHTEITPCITQPVLAATNEFRYLSLSWTEQVNAPLQRWAPEIFMAFLVVTMLLVIVTFKLLKSSSTARMAPITSQSVYDNPTFTKLVSYYAQQPHDLLVDESNQNYTNSVLLAEQKNREVDKMSPFLHTHNNNNHKNNM